MRHDLELGQRRRVAVLNSRHLSRVVVDLHPGVRLSHSFARIEGSATRVVVWTSYYPLVAHAICGGGLDAIWRPVLSSHRPARNVASDENHSGLIGSPLRTMPPTS